MLKDGEVFENKKNSMYNKQLTSEDYYLSKNGYIVFTEKYHLKRGYCCASNCMHCPYLKKTDE